MRGAGILIGFLFLAIVLVIAFNGASLVRGFDYKPNMAEAASATLAALTAVALFVERGVSVINAILFGDDERAAELQLIRNDPQGPDNLKKVLGSKARVRALVSFVAGLFISAAGVRTLEGLLQTNAQGAPHNGFLFPVDVILTAALIAGGSNLFAVLAQNMKDRLAGDPEVNVPPVAPVAAAPRRGEEAPDQAVRPRSLKYARTRLT